jgi:hypothetical protein
MPEHRARQTTLALLLGLAGLVLYLAIALRHVEPFTTAVYKGPLGADTLNGAEAYAKLKYEWKHPLMSPATAGATALFRLLPGFDRSLAIAGGVALLATSNLLLCALVLRRLLGDPAAAMLGTALYALLFTNLNVLAVTDSYTVSSLAIWLFLLAWVSQPETGTARPWTRLGPLSGVAGLCNPPLLALAGLPAMRTLLAGRLRRAVTIGLATATIALALVLAVVLTHSTLKWGTPWAYLTRSAGYTEHYAELEHVTRLGYLTDVLSCFLLFAVASPVDVVPGNGLTRAAAAGYLEDPGGRLALAAVALILGGAAVSLFGRYWRTTLPLAAWIAALAVFYTFFNPIDAMLYSTQVQGVLAVLACLGFASHTRDPRTLHVLLGTAVLLLALRNLPIVLFAPYGFEFWHAPNPVPANAP